ncbi:hypothetical protein ANN_25167 [Periplaneta americana]|uniref:Reverse transcriptase n=1 Tax=Periplaneta americana TaxID=6978 RepID=A0ABQ8S0U7_PERAM|nr:hypothetical protein ANN_25167 [Periplaneta americana]
MEKVTQCRTARVERIPNLTGEQSEGITVFRIPPMKSLTLHQCHTSAISLQRWWQSPSAAISESDWFLYRAGISRRMTSCTVVSWRLDLLSKNLKVRIYKTVILPVLLYGCETWTLTLREEHRLRVFENKVLRKIFGAKRDEVTGEWRKLHNTELHALCCSPDIIRNIKSRRLRWAGHVARMGESSNAYRVLVGRPEGKKPLGRPRRRWEDDIKMDLREVGYDDRDWINLAQDRDRWRAYVRAAMNLETWTLTLREGQRLRVFENKVLRKIFGAKRDEVTGEWRKLHNAELHELYSSPDIIRNIKSRLLRWAGHVARMGESKNAYRVWTKITKDGRLHYPFEVRELLDRRFPGRWIGRAGPTAWPPRSPDMTPLNFFLWGFTIDLVFVPPLTDHLAELRNRIIASVEEVTPGLLASVWQDIDSRLDVVIPQTVYTSSQNNCVVETFL